MAVAQSVRFSVPAFCTSDSPFFVFSFSPRCSSTVLPGPYSSDASVIKPNTSEAC